MSEVNCAVHLHTTVARPPPFADNLPWLNTLLRSGRFAAMARRQAVMRTTISRCSGDWTVAWRWRWRGRARQSRRVVGSSSRPTSVTISSRNTAAVAWCSTRRTPAGRRASACRSSHTRRTSSRASFRRRSKISFPSIRTMPPCFLRRRGVPCRQPAACGAKSTGQNLRVGLSRGWRVRLRRPTLPHALVSARVSSVRAASRRRDAARCNGCGACDSNAPGCCAQPG